MVLIKRFLDVGVQTLLIPYIQTAQEAADAVAYTRYPLRGVRGVAGTTRATRFGRVKDYFKRAEEELCVLVQVETRLGLDNLDAIINTDGVDGVFIGPADLSAGLGHLGNIPHPEVQKAIDDAIRRIRKAGKAPGILAPVEADARRYLDQGCLFVAVGADVGLLARESEKLCAKFKS
jgi:4-hydroxy-2-oxoheptanedioate aldolase